jgi:hypothetical protein
VQLKDGEKCNPEDFLVVRIQGARKIWNPRLVKLLPEEFPMPGNAWGVRVRLFLGGGA